MPSTAISPALTGPEIGPEWRRSAWRAAAIAALALLVYLPALRAGFFWDDDVFLTHNKLIASADGLRSFWFTAQAPDYFPLTSSVLWVEWRLWGNHAAGYHLVNVLLHAAGAVLLWRLLLRLRVPGAWLAGLLFAVHPVAVASAAWISELKNTLSLALGLASVLAYLRFEDGRMQNAGGMESAECRVQNAESSREPASPELLRVERAHSGEARSSSHSAPCTLHSALCTRYVLSLALFLLALLAKTSVVLLPAILLLCAWWRRGKISRRDLFRSAPFFALSLALGAATVWFQRHNSIGAGAVVRPEGMISRIAATGWIAWFYLFKILLPAGLCVIYPRWSVSGSSAPAFLPLALLIVVAAWLWRNRNGWSRGPLFALGGFAAMLLPVLGLVDMAFMRFSLVADHLQYAAMIAVIALAAGVAASVSHNSRISHNFSWLAAAACLAALGILTWRRAALYADAPRLWQDNAAKNPACWMAWDELGLARNSAGQYAEAVVCFDRALALPSNPAKVYNNRALAFAGMGRYDRALDDYGRALELDPRAAAAWNNRALARMALRQYDAAIRDCTQATALKPDFLEAYYARANAYQHLGHCAEAVVDYNKVLELKPDFAEAYENRGVAYARSGDLNAALRDFNRAIALKPQSAGVYYNRARLHAQRREFAPALADVQQYEKLGGRPDADFVQSLVRAAAQRSAPAP